VIRTIDTLVYPPSLAISGTAYYVLLALLFLGLIAVTVMLVQFARLRTALRQLRVGAKRFAHGDLSRRLDVKGPLNVSSVAESLNQMASQLEERLEAVIDQRNEFSAVVSNMSEGVMTLDRQERIASMNPAAGKLLRLSVSKVLGRTIQEVIRNPALQRMVQHVLEHGSRISGEVEFRTAEPDDEGSRLRIFDVNVSMLQRGGQRTGALIVVHDNTRVHHLENVRRDFVANVSHELKTPVAAIKAAAETLGDLDPDEADAGERFLRIVARNAERLEAIIDDLLTLAKLEEHGETTGMGLTPQSVLRVLKGAVESCQSKADEKRMDVQILCDPSIGATMHAPMLEQAVVNLLDNAIKYSPAESDVVLSASVDGSELNIAVADHGPGIEPRDQHRLFERFYRTDKARSRALGGTGLGLAIVKHIAQVHSGRVTLESKPGEGSRFIIHLPLDEKRTHAASPEPPATLRAGA